ncbi:MAG: cysteine hydrolase family protein [Marmoricola sp.]
MTTTPTATGHVPGTTPYAWPWDAVLDPARTAVLVVGPARGLTLAGSAEGARARAVVDVVLGAGGAVVQVVTAPPPAVGPAAPAAGPPLADAAFPVLSARGVDGFYGSGLDDHLRASGRDHLLLVGAGLETCIHSTMRSANDRGLECLLVLDACVPYDRALVGSARSQVEMSGGIFGAVGSTAEVFDAYAALVP